MVRILFLLFSEDTTIFNKQQFQDYIEQRTNEDGSDLASRLQELFQVLNTAKENRFKNLDEQLSDFPYINGKLFEENLPTASFDTKMRQALLDCCHKAVDLAYRPQPFTSEANRMVFLFELYEKYTADLFTTSKKKVFKIPKHDDRK